MKNAFIRLSKLMSERGICSRREADRYIEKGMVLVDGGTVSELGTKVGPNVKIELKKQAKQQQSNKITIILNKPVGYVSTQPEKGYTEALSLINPENQWKGAGSRPFHPAHLRKLAVAGRLDINSSGLLILTQDGSLAKKLLSSDTDIEKEYIVRVEGAVNPKVLASLRYGLMLDGKKLKKAKVDTLEPQLLRICLKEGKKRQIRRMCELVGLKVSSLKRVRVGRLVLGNLPRGKWRYVSPDEVI